MSQHNFGPRFTHITAAANALGLPEQWLADCATLGFFRGNLRISLDGGVTFQWFINVKNLEAYLDCVRYHVAGEEEERRGITDKDHMAAEKRMGLHETRKEKAAKKAQSKKAVKTALAQITPAWEAATSAPAAVSA